MDGPELRANYRASYRASIDASVPPLFAPQPRPPPRVTALGAGASPAVCARSPGSRAGGGNRPHPQRVILPPRACNVAARQSSPYEVQPERGRPCHEPVPQAPLGH
jgi:hypothetical protein